MSIDTLISQSFRLQFNDAFMLTYQQASSKFRPYVTEQSCDGEGATAADLIGQVTAKTSATRAPVNEDNIAQINRRWLVWPNETYTGQYLDKRDFMRMATEPRSELLQAHAAAIARAQDELILGVEGGKVAGRGILGSVTTGKTPTSTQNLPSAQTIAHGSTGLSITKLLEARERLMAADVDFDMTEMVLAVSPAQDRELLEIATDAVGQYPAYGRTEIVEGKVAKLLGFKLMVTNRLPKSGTTRTCVAWNKADIKLGIWEDVQTRVINDSHRDNTPHAKVFYRMDCVRVRDEGVVAIECTES